MLPGICDQETDPFYNKYEKQGGQGTALSDSSRGTEELRGSTIDQYNKICWSEASHYLINTKERHPNLNQNESNVSPVNSVKCLY